MKLSLALLREVLDYNPDTGIFTRRSGRFAGSVAGGINSWHGYVVVSVERRLYRAHRLAWFYVYGEWPATEIDHINRDKTDNRIANLRLASRSQNQVNAGLQRNNTSGFKGVSWSKSNNKWHARISVADKNIHLGMFTDAAEAGAAYLAAAKQYYGEFASDGKSSSRLHAQAPAPQLD